MRDEDEIKGTRICADHDGESSGPSVDPVHGMQCEHADNRRGHRAGEPRGFDTPVVRSHHVRLDMFVLNPVFTFVFTFVFACVFTLLYLHPQRKDGQKLSKSLSNTSPPGTSAPIPPPKQPTPKSTATTSPRSPSTPPSPRSSSPARPTASSASTTPPSSTRTS